MTIRDYMNIVEGRLDELFDSASGITWTDKTHATFDVNGKHYVAQFKQDAGGGNAYEFSFYTDQPAPNADLGSRHTFGNTGTAGRASTRVFGLSLECIEQFVHEYAPGSVWFVGQKETGRDVLYNRMALALRHRVDKMGYTMDIKNRERTGLMISLRRTNSALEDWQYRRLEKALQDSGVDLDAPEEFTDADEELLRSLGVIDEDYDEEDYDDEAETAEREPQLHDYSPSEAMALPTFRKWFGASKVTDSYGPQIVYHGRREKWTQMKTGEAERFRDWLVRANMDKKHAHELAFAQRLGDVTWFTDDESIAHGYRDSETDGDVLEAYLSIQNPLDLRVSVIGVAKLEAILSAIYQTPQKVDLNYSEELGAARAIVYDNSIVMQFARANGHDGVIHDDTDVQGRYTHTSYVVFKPTQIKACLNTGEFSSSDPNIHR